MASVHGAVRRGQRVVTDHDEAPDGHSECQPKSKKNALLKGRVESHNQIEMLLKIPTKHGPN